jgi:hypothetical protein
MVMRAFERHSKNVKKTIMTDALPGPAKTYQNAAFHPESVSNWHLTGY